MVAIHRVGATQRKQIAADAAYLLAKQRPVGAGAALRKEFSGIATIPYGEFRAMLTDDRLEPVSVRAVGHPQIAPVPELRGVERDAGRWRRVSHA